MLIAAFALLSPFVWGAGFSEVLRAATLEDAAYLLQRVFDGRRDAVVFDSRSLERLRQVRQLLSLGTPQPDGSWVGPFVFHPEAGGEFTAPAAGLEGFVYAEGRLPAGSARHHLQDYGRYLDALLGPIPWAAGARQTMPASGSLYR